jgi:hypothetical protein
MFRSNITQYHKLGPSNAGWTPMVPKGPRTAADNPKLLNYNCPN